MASQYERLLAVEWIAVFAIETGDALYSSKEKKFSLPQPQRYFATMIAYLMLAGLALFGEGAAKVAAALGGVAALTIVLAPATPAKPVSKTNPSIIVNFFGWLAAMYTTPPKTIGSPTPTTGSGQKVNPQSLTTGTRHTPGLRTGVAPFTGASHLAAGPTGTPVLGR